MRKSVGKCWFPMLLLAAVSAPLAGQDQFGRSVGVAGDEVFVLKANPGRGPAAVYVFNRSESGAWKISQRIAAPRGAVTGEGLSPSIAASDHYLMIGSGDPEGRVAAHLFSRDPDSDRWQTAASILLESGVSPPDSSSDGITLSTVMRILQPPRRIVSVDGRRALVAVLGRSGRVRIFEGQEGSESWASVAEFASDTTSDGFGSAVALRGDVALVGAPRRGATGAVHVYERNPVSGEWREGPLLRPADVTPAARFGGAIALDAHGAWIGAPGLDRSAGGVVAYRVDPSGGGWVETARFRPDSGSAPARLGSAIGVAGGEVWVGAPGAKEGRGLVYRFAMSGNQWQREIVAVSGLEERNGFGSSIALGDGVAVVGVPGADGGRGRAVVFAETQGSWSEGDWLRSGEDLAAVRGGEVKCADGSAGRFMCDNVDLLAFLPTESIGGRPGEGVSDVWGWTDPETGREYALVGRSGGAAFVDITDPASPLYIGEVPANRSGARDLKVYQNHLFFTGDGAGAHGLIVFDLTRLRDVGNSPVTFEPDTKYDGIASAHNLVIDTDGGLAIPVGASGGGETCGGGLHMVDIRNPLEPVFAGCYTDTEGLIWPGRTHDAQCVVYRGPDTEYSGRQICFASNETALRIVDVTDKANPVPLAAATYPGIAYAHQGWLTDDQRYFYLDDELDELVGLASRTRTLVWDVSVLDDPVLVGEFLGSTGATDHNLFIKGDRMYQANYQAGLSVVDISDPERPVQVGFFDTTPYDGGNPPGFNGAWTAYPFFASGTVIVSSMNEGLFVLRPLRQQLVP